MDKNTEERTTILCDYCGVEKRGKIPGISLFKAFWDGKESRRVCNKCIIKALDTVLGEKVRISNVFKNEGK